MISLAPLPLETIFWKTVLAIFPESVPSLTSRSSSASADGETGDSGISLPASFRAPSNSVCTQFAATFASGAEPATASK